MYELSPDEPSKVETPVTPSAFLSADLDIAGRKLGTCLARLAAGAPTIINAVGYRRITFDLPARRAADSAHSDRM